MRRFAGWFGLFLVLLLGLGFASSNAGRQVTIDLGIFTLYGVPITFVAFGGMLVGMGVVLMAGINADLKVRALLEHPRPTRDDRLKAAASEDSPASDAGQPGGRHSPRPEQLPFDEDLPLDKELPLE